MAESKKHFVYLYRDRKGKPRYIGYGSEIARALAHQKDTHSEKLRPFVRKGELILEIAGPFGSRGTGLAVETALISAMKPDCNVSPGKKSCRFRPIGIPEEYADRLSEAPLSISRLRAIVPANKFPVMFVYIGNQDFSDGRKGYSLAKPPDEKSILSRLEKYWFIGRRLKQWAEDPSTSPGVLVGVSGPPAARIIIASALIERSRWRDSILNNEKQIVPTFPTRDLDAFNLRGRHIAPSMGIRFNSFRPQQYKILNSDGSFV